MHQYKKSRTILKSHSDQKLHWQHKDKQNNNNFETEMVTKTTQWIFQQQRDEIPHEKTVT